MSNKKIPSAIEVIDIVDRALSDRTIVLEFIEAHTQHVEGLSMGSLLMFVRRNYAEFDESALIPAMLIMMLLRIHEAAERHSIQLSEAEDSALAEVLRNIDSGKGLAQ